MDYYLDEVEKLVNQNDFGFELKTRAINDAPFDRISKDLYLYVEIVEILKNIPIELKFLKTNGVHHMNDDYDIFQYLLIGRSSEIDYHCYLMALKKEYEQRDKNKPKTRVKYRIINPQSRT